jgi:hypothetical protein
MGAATPEVSEPSPSFSSVGASSLAVGVRPWADWKCCIALIVLASHLPFGAPSYAPWSASADWISEMRAGVGAVGMRWRAVVRRFAAVRFAAVFDALFDVDDGFAVDLTGGFVDFELVAVVVCFFRGTA